MFVQQEEMTRWVKAIVTSFFVFLFFSIYLYLRRGYYDLYIINKVFGSTAAVVAGLTLIIGPLSRRFPYWASWMTIRRHLGLTAFGLGFGHMVFSVFFLPNKFPLSWYQREWFPILTGILAVLVWVYLAYISSNKKIQEMGSDIWKKHQQVGGRIALILVFVHLVVMKYPGWFRWFQGQTRQSPELANPTYPPASLFVLVAMLGVIGYRVFNYFRRGRDPEINLPAGKAGSG